MSYPMRNYSSVQGAQIHRETRTGAQHANGRVSLWGCATD